MVSSKKFMYLFSSGIIGLSILFLFSKSDTNFLILISNAIIPTSTIVYGNFTCETWRNFSYINVSKYQQCLTWRPNEGFWAVQGLRHTAHKHLLNSSSLIIEVGGNSGHDTVRFIELHNPSIISYEPLVSMSKDLSKQFKSNPKIEIRPYGLGNRARNLSVEPNDQGNAGTSIFRKLSSANSSKIQQIQLLDIIETIQNIRKTRTINGMIDMLSINCEGCEFEILPALILNNMTQYFRIIQFASHTGLVSKSPCIYCQIEQALERTHQTFYHYTMLWEGWTLKNKTKN
jgi:FkbM family methyltransferase